MVALIHEPNARGQLRTIQQVWTASPRAILSLFVSCHDSYSASTTKLTGKPPRVHRHYHTRIDPLDAFAPQFTVVGVARSELALRG